jgi:tol-pal system protein YbgF
MPQRMSRSAKFAVVLALFALAARAQESRAQDSVSDLVARVDRLEEAMRNLTGSIEQLQYQNRQLQHQVQSLEGARQPGSAAARPAAPAAQYAPAPRPSYAAPPPAQYSPPPAQQYSPPPQYAPQAQAGSRRHDAFDPAAAPNAVGEPEPLVTDEADAAPGSGRHDAFDPALAPGAPGAPRPLGASTGANEPPARYEPPADGRSVADASGPQAQSPSGGALPPPPPINPSATGAMPAALPPSNTPNDEYGLAYGYFQHKDYVRAADTFNAFVRQHPSDRLTPEAQYWLGESLYRTRQYHDAAEAFLTVSTKYEANARAPDALLRLGQSLAALGQKEAACASLGEVLRKYPRASSSVKESVAREQKRVHC